MIKMMMTMGSGRRSGYTNPNMNKIKWIEFGKNNEYDGAHDTQTKQITTFAQLIVAYTCTYPTHSHYGNALIFQCIEHEWG